MCGEPGIYSARYGGENLSGMDRINLVLRNLETAPSENRIARFVCSISIVGLTAQPLIAQGAISGMINDKPQGEHGFGYDPIFLLPSLNTTMAALDPHTKNLISHRADALRKIIVSLQKLKDIS